MTALHEASHKGHHQVVQTLLEHGADVNALDKVSSTKLTKNNSLHFDHDLFYFNSLKIYFLGK